MRTCEQCGAAFEGDVCPYCGKNYSAVNQQQAAGGYQQPAGDAQQPIYQNNFYAGAYAPAVSSKSKIATLLLCIFLGELGVHRFYAGKIGTGILWLLTAGCCGIGWLVDIIMIAVGSFKDGNGLPISN